MVLILEGEERRVLKGICCKNSSYMNMIVYLFAIYFSWTLNYFNQYTCELFVDEYVSDFMVVCTIC